MKKKKTKCIDIKKIILVYLLVYFVIAGMYCGITGTVPQGEWDDYMYPTVTLITEQRISVIESDLSAIKEFFPEWTEDIDKMGINWLSGRQTRSGGTLTWYFPTYSVFCIPMILLLRFLELPAIYAFVFTNLAVVMIMLWVIYKYLDVEDKIKLMLIVLASINPVVFYYVWPSAEVLIYALLGIGLVCWHNGWYRRAAIFVSLAGMMNTTIMCIGIVMIIEYLVKLIVEKKKKDTWKQYIIKNIPDVIKYGCCYIIGLIPMIYFYYHTGYINLTASYESFTTSTETVGQRFFAYLFDLNYGILPYYVFVLIIGFVMLVVACIRKHWRYVEWFVAFCVNVLLYSLMVHINHGMAGSARYNVWGVLLLIFALCIYSNEILIKDIWKKMLRIGVWLNICVLCWIVYTYGPMGASKTSYSQLTPIAKMVLDYVPGVYNPIHSTFKCRVKEDTTAQAYMITEPIVYAAEDGYVRKILAGETDAQYLQENFILNNNAWFEKKVEELSEKKTYISVPYKYKMLQCAKYSLNETISFVGQEYNADSYIVRGRVSKEDWGAWILGKEFGMRLRTDSSKEMLHGVIKYNAFLNWQGFHVKVNDELVFSGYVKGEDIEFDFVNPGAGEPITITFEIPTAVSPNEVGNSTDTRVLGIGLREIVITE